MSRSLTIEEDNLSVAWAKAFLCVVEAGEIAPLSVVIRGFADGQPMEVAPIRQFLDDALGADEKALSCNEVANTISPTRCGTREQTAGSSTSATDESCRVCCETVETGAGVYFQRLIAFGQDANYESGVNQLEHIIQTWHGGNHRRSALQAVIFDPRKDHTNQRMRGFPCLQQVAFAPKGPDGLTVTGFYATQYIFERAYGNYLGLCRLGRFMAQEMGRQLTQVTCVASPAKRDKTKGFPSGSGSGS